MEKQNIQLMKPQKTWFFEKDGVPFGVNEKEAWELITNKSSWRRNDIEMLGMSDGQKFHEIVKAAGPRREELQVEIKALQEKLDKYIKGHDRLLFDEFAEEDDPRVLRAKELIKKTEDEMEPLETELKELRSGLISKAFNAELEVARGNMVRPGNQDILTPQKGGNPSHQAMLENFRKSKGV